MVPLSLWRISLLSRVLDLLVRPFQVCEHDEHCPIAKSNALPTTKKCLFTHLSFSLLGELMHLGGLKTLRGLRLDGTAVVPATSGDIDSFRAVTGCDIVVMPERKQNR